MKSDKKLTIKYFGNFDNPFSDSTEKHISYALKEMGHEVIEYNEKDFDLEEMTTAKGDLFLFHKGGHNSGVELPKLVEILNKVTCPKVFWYFDKVEMGQRELWMRTILPFVDHGFITDGSWVRRNNYDNTSVLMQGIGNEDMSLGKKVDRFDLDVVFTGSIYGDRARFVEALKSVYRDRFKLFNNVFGRDLYDLAASAKIFTAPRSIQTDHYWSSRVYMVLGSGGFLIHPKLEGMKEEFEDGKHLVFYLNGNDLREKIDYYLEHDDERKAIQKAGYEHVKKHYTYQHRMTSLIETLENDGIL